MSNLGMLAKVRVGLFLLVAMLFSSTAWALTKDSTGIKEGEKEAVNKADSSIKSGVTDMVKNIKDGKKTSESTSDFVWDEKQNAYVINTAQGWKDFCDSVKKRKDFFTGLTVKLGADITVTSSKGSHMVGNFNKSKPNDRRTFTGFFDGDGHTLTFNESEAPKYGAPFSVVEGGENGASISNLKVNGTIATTTNTYAAGLVGTTFGKVTIKNCLISVTIDSKISGDGSHGGIVAVQQGNDEHGAIIIEGSVFDGRILGEATHSSAGLIGYSNYTSKIINSIFAPADINISNKNGANFTRNKMPDITNSYYTVALDQGDNNNIKENRDQGKKAYTITVGDNTTIAYGSDEDEIKYSASGLTAYNGKPGLKFCKKRDNESDYCTYYAANGEEIALTLGHSDISGYNFSQYVVNAGTLSGEANPYTLTMPESDVTVTSMYLKSLNHKDISVAKSLTIDDITVSEIAKQTYNGNEIKPEVFVKDGETELVENEDYELIYSDNTNAGTAKVTIKGKSNYSGEKDVEFEIVAKSLTSNDITVSEIAKQTYNGNEIKPEVFVKDGETELVENEDYELIYSDNTNAGTAKVTIKGKSNYFGEKDVEFEIVAKSLTIDDITVSEIAKQTYNGNEIKPEVFVKDGETELVENRDYTLSYSDNMNVGTAKVTISGKNNYTDDKDVEFKIAKSIEYGSITISDIADQLKTGNEIKPSVTVMDAETELVEGQDYTLIYYDNTDAGIAKVTINGIENYTGSRTVKFHIYDPSEVVWYLDENGEEKFFAGCTEIVVDDAESGNTAGVALQDQSGCYVVKGEVSYENNFSFSGKDVKLILTDGAKLTVTNTSENTWFYKFSIYAQSKGEKMGQFVLSATNDGLYADSLIVNGGAVKVESSEGCGLYAGVMIVNGGNVSVTGDVGVNIGMYGLLTINGGVVNATSNGTRNAILIGDNGSFAVNGGSLTAKATSGSDILTNGSLSLNGGTVVADGNGIEAAIPSCSSSMAYGVELGGATVKAASYKMGSDAYDNKASVFVTEGVFYTDGKGNSFSGTLTDEQIAAIAGKNMHPYIPAIQFKKYVKSDGSKGVLADFNANYNEIVPFGISEEMTVDSVEFKREFTTVTNGYATVLFPFDVQANNLEGVETIVAFAGVNAQYQVMMNVVWKNEHLTEKDVADGKVQPDYTLKAHTPYMVHMSNPTLTIHGPVTLKPIEKDTYEIEIGNWKFIGTYVFKVWSADDKDLNHAYGYTTVSSSKFNAGEFVIIAKNAITRAFRAYLVETQPQAIAARKPFQNNVGAQTVLSSSYSTPEYMEVVIIDKDEEGKEHTTVIGRFNTRTGEIKLNPAGDRVYDLKGRIIRKDAKKARGVYYGKKAGISNQGKI